MEVDRQALTTVGREEVPSSRGRAQVIFRPHANTIVEVAAYLPLGKTIRKPFEEPVVFGRGVGVDVHINAIEASRQHAYLGPLPLWMQPAGKVPAPGGVLNTGEVPALLSTFALVNRSRVTIQIDEKDIKPGECLFLPEECRIHFGPVSFDLTVRPGCGPIYEVIFQTL